MVVNGLQGAVVEFGEAVREAMQAQGLSLRAAAKSLNYDPAYLSRVLSGRQSPSGPLVLALDTFLGQEGRLLDLAPHKRLARSQDGLRDRSEPANDGHRRSAAGAAVHAVADAAEEIEADSLFAVPVWSDATFEILQEEVALLARAGGLSAFDTFRIAKRLREEARNLVEKTRRPAQLADLYSVIGQGTALMASTAFDLGYWTQSTSLANAAGKYAALAGHRSLEAWAYGLQMTLANWRGDPDAALVYLARGERVAPPGEPALRLKYIAARSYALMGDRSSVQEAINLARRDRDQAEGHPDELSCSVGGEFEFGEARAAACAAAGWLDLQSGEDAIRSAKDAIRAYEEVPAYRRPYSQINGARIDVATGSLHIHDLDAASEALVSVLELPAEKRNISLSGRLEKVSGQLASSSWDRNPGAQSLRESVVEWLKHPSVDPTA
jgi:transcriptional regulator with XRE-family HTH domain